MFRYKNAKHKSNYLKVRITAGTDFESGDDNHTGEVVCLRRQECELVFSLFPGDHTVSARFVAGTIGEDTLVGETAVHYTYRNHTIQVCDYDFVPCGYYRKTAGDTQPAFRLYRKREHANGYSEEQLLFEISSGLDIDLKNGTGSAWMTDAGKGIRKQLRTIYTELQDALYDTNIALTIHMEDELKTDDNGRVVGGTWIGVQTDFSDYFYNVDESTDDEPEESSSYPGRWLGYYNDKVLQYCLDHHRQPVHNVTGHRYCAAPNQYLTCTPSTSRRAYVGGHVLINLDSRNIQVRRRTHTLLVTGLDRTVHQIPLNPSGPKPRYDQDFTYYMLPICSHHNNYNYYDVVMYANHLEDLLILQGFRADY